MKKIEKELDLVKGQVNIDVGLTEKEVLEKVSLGQTNKTKKGSTKSIGGIMFNNIFTFFNMLIFVIGGALIYVKSYKDIYFLIIALANILIGIFQEVKAKRTIDKLSLLSTSTTLVLRDKEEQQINIDEVVLNDLLVLKSGNQVVADSFIRKGIVEVDESLLTGEVDLVLKKEGDYLYSGSFISSGNCVAETVKVGKETYVETITSKARKYKKPSSDLMNSLKIIIRTITILIIPIGIIVLKNNLINNDLNFAIKTAAELLIIMIPSGLFLLTSIALVVGVVKLAEQKTLVQELYCLEMLARVDTICFDKTGTITYDTMEVTNVYDFRKDNNFEPKTIIPDMMSALNDSNQTSKALISKFGLPVNEPNVISVIEFSSDNMYSAVELEDLGTFVIGAPENVLVKTEYNKIKTKVEEYASQGLRVLLYAHSKGSIRNNKLPTSVRPLSLFLLEEKIRKDATSTIEYFKTQGVDIKVISGDNPITASKIASRAGIDNADKYVSLEGYTTSEVQEAATEYQVFGRVTPEQKETLIKALKNQRKTVAMVGDGVNDVLALKEADASIAMASGSEAARNASHLVMLDSNLGPMTEVVNEGRRVINNIQKVASLFLTKTIFSIILAFLILIADINHPFTTDRLFYQLFFINVVAIGFPSFIISFQPNSNVVKGRLINKVLKESLPGALAIVAQITIVLLIFGPKLDLESKEVLTLAIVTATFTAFVVLFKALKPFNLVRRLTFGVAIGYAIIAILFAPQFFDISPLLSVDMVANNTAIIPLMLMILTSSLFIDFFAKTPKYIDRGLRWFFRKLSGV